MATVYTTAQRLRDAALVSRLTWAEVSSATGISTSRLRALRAMAEAHDLGDLDYQPRPRTAAPTNEELRGYLDALAAHLRSAADAVDAVKSTP